MKLVGEKPPKTTQCAPHAHLTPHSLPQYPNYAEPHTTTCAEAWSTCETVPKNPHQ
jgi:hypothetical protein